ncbi:MAG: hypothetical protein Q4D02_06905 [Clostridia bacterium]|nr:hypothetical protein [Clostridia bacterium]
MIILFIILILVISIIVIPVRFKIQYREDEKKNLQVKNKIEIYILYFIKIKTVKMKDKSNIDKEDGEYRVNAIYKILNMYLKYLRQQEMIMTKEDLKKIFDSIYIEKMNLKFGINLSNPILNAYVIVLANTIINMFIMKNERKMKLKNIEYSTYVSENIFNLKLNCIIRFHLANTIITIIKMIIRIREVSKKNGKESSNRFSNANSYDIN